MGERENAICRNMRIVAVRKSGIGRDRTRWYLKKCQQDKKWRYINQVEVKKIRPIQAPQKWCTGRFKKYENIKKGR